MKKGNAAQLAAGTYTAVKVPFRQRVVKDFQRNWPLYLMILPILIYYAIFKFGPLFGVSIAFMDYKPARGFLGSKFIGLKHFKNFFTDFYFLRLLKNTIRISLFDLLTFPAPIMLALLINELKHKTYSRVVQTVTYMPHFISTVVICGMIRKLTGSSGGITMILSNLFGIRQEAMLNNVNNFLPIYIISEIWQSIGWNSIIYLSALAGIDQELYDAARVDGAGRLKQVLYITIPCLMPTITILLILKMGKIFNVGYEKIMLLYNPMIYEKADVINTFVYRKGLLDAQYSYSAAVGLFNCAVSYTLVTVTNKISKRVNGNGLW